MPPMPPAPASSESAAPMAQNDQQPVLQKNGESNVPPAVGAPPQQSLAGEDKFGTKGTLAISNDVGLNINYTHTSESGAGSVNQFSFQLVPGVDYFLMENFSVGAFVGFNYINITGSHHLDFQVGGRAGYNLWLTDRISLWGRAGLSYHKVDNAGSAADSSSLALNISAPFLYNMDRFFIGFGPALDVDLTGDSKSTTIAGRLIFGGWL